MTPRYPDIQVRLTDETGNVFFILGKVRKALKEAGLRAEQISAYTSEATSDDYNHFLRTTRKWVDVL